MRDRNNLPRNDLRFTPHLLRLTGSALTASLILFLAFFSLPAQPFSPYLPLGVSEVYADGGLDISKTVVPTQTVAQGDLLTYTIVVTNVTGSNLIDVVVTDTVPSDVACQSISAPSEWFYNLSACQAGLARWRLPNIGGRVLDDDTTVVFSYTVLVDQPAPDGRVIQNQAGSYGVTGDEQVGPGSFLDIGPDDVNVTVQAPEWAISKTSNPTDTVEAGDIIEYTITVTNIGSLATEGSYIITDVIPINTTFSSSPFPSQVGSGLLTLTVNSVVGPGQGMDINWFAQVTKPLTPGVIITNTAYGVSGGGVYSNVVSATPITVEITAGPLLQISKTANAPSVTPGDFITYTITYENIGSGNLAGTILISDVIPAHTSIDSVVPPTSTQSGSRELGWSVTGLPIDDPRLITVTVQVDTPLPNGIRLTNTVAITSSGVSVVDGGVDEAVVTVNSHPVLQLT